MKLAFISHPRHVTKLDPKDTVAICHSWLLARTMQVYGWRADTCRELDPALAAKTRGARDWLHTALGRHTDFHGVNLLDMFARELDMAAREIYGIGFLVRNMIEKYGATEVLYFDARAEHSVLDEAARFKVTSAAAGLFGIRATDHRDGLTGADEWLPFSEFYGRHVSPDTGGVGRALFRMLAGLVRRRGQTLVAATHLTAKPIMHEAENISVLSDWWPNKSDVFGLLNKIGRGILPANVRRPRLTVADRLELESVSALLGSVRRNLASTGRRTLVDYVGKYIVENGRMNEMARDVKWAYNLLRKYWPRLVFTDGLDFPLTRILLRVAKALDIPTAATWHAPYVFDVKPPIMDDVDVFLSWGAACDRWLSGLWYHGRRIRTGSPFRRIELIGMGVQARRVLLCQYVAPAEEYRFPQVGGYPFFVRAIQMLKHAGFPDSSVVLKIHPGPYSQDHYTMVQKKHGFDCVIKKDTTFAELVSWADIVIGPFYSGAMVETLAAGKPYYPVLLSPHSVPGHFYNGHPVYKNLREVERALSKRPTDFSGLLDDFSAKGSLWRGLQEAAR